MSKGAAKAPTKARKKDAKRSPADPPETAPPAGQRLYDMPYGAPAPRLIDPTLGLHNLVARAGHNAGYDIDLTLLDAADHRMIRSGVLLAHRVLDGRGEWYLGAPDWEPLLPRELIAPMSTADLSEELADLVRPFRRRAPLGPVAALTCQRREFALRDDRGTTLALLRDDKVTVRRGGLTTARYREVMMTPVGPGLSLVQADFVDARLTAAGATAVERFPRLVRRLGAPATGLTDYPVPPPLDASAPFSQFVSRVVAGRLRDVVVADLGVRQGDPAAAGVLADRLARTAAELGALSPVLDADWAADLTDELGWAAETVRAAQTEDAGRLADRLRGERYLGLLDRLVSAARAPRLAAPDEGSALQVLDALSARVLRAMRRAADRLSVDAPGQRWIDAYAAFSRYAAVAAIARLMEVPETRTTARLAVCERLLRDIEQQDQHARQTLDAIPELSPAAAFEAGRAFERERERTDALRFSFVDRWAKTSKKLDARQREG